MSDPDYFKYQLCCKAGSREHAGHGCAIDEVSEVVYQPEWAKKQSNTKNQKVGTLWAGNGEYDTQVDFCPFCGIKAKVPTKKS